MELKRSLSKLLVPGAMFIFTLILIIESWDYPDKARIFPQTIGFIFLILLTFLIWCILVEMRSINKSDTKDESKNQYDFKKWLFSGISIVIYTLLMYLVGFIVSSIIFTAALMWLLGLKRPILVGIITLCSVVLIWTIFQKILYIPLPEGILFNMNF